MQHLAEQDRNFFSSYMKRTILTAGGLIAFWTLSPAFGEGSISWDDVRVRIQKDDPEFVALVESAFEIRRVGLGRRVGQDSSGKSTVEGVEVGTRVPPYEFLAKIKGSQSLYTLCLVFTPSEGQAKTWQVTVRRNLDAD
jgi:hypothetical protein